MHTAFISKKKMFINNIPIDFNNMVEISHHFHNNLELAISQIFAVMNAANDNISFIGDKLESAQAKFSDLGVLPDLSYTSSVAEVNHTALSLESDVSYATNHLQNMRQSESNHETRQHMLKKAQLYIKAIKNKNEILKTDIQHFNFMFEAEKLKHNIK